MNVVTRSVCVVRESGIEPDARHFIRMVAAPEPHPPAGDTIGIPLALWCNLGYYINMNDLFDVAGAGRPPKRAELDCKSVGMSFKVDPRLKNLLMDISDGYGISMTELLLVMALKEAGVEHLVDLANLDG